MGIQLPDLVENVVGKGKIARYKLLLLFQECFKSFLLLMRQNEYLLSKGLNCNSRNRISHVLDIVFYLSTTQISIQYHPYFFLLFYHGYF